MKAILLVAVLAVAASAFNLTAYRQGFSDQFNFTSTQFQDGTTCFAGISSILANAQSALQMSNFPGFFGVLQGAQSEILMFCGQYIGDFQGFMAAHATSDPKTVFAQYWPYVIQDLAQWGNLLAANEDYLAGQQEAFILQTLVGAQVPQTLPTPQFNFSTYVQFDMDTFLTEYLGAFINGIGLASEVNSTDLVTCAQAFNGLAATYPNTTIAFAEADFAGKIDAVQAFTNSLFAVLKGCQPAFQDDAIIFTPIIAAFQQNPTGALYTLLNNIASNLPETVNSYVQQQVDIMEGNYTGAGEEKAFRHNTYFTGLGY